MLRVPVAALPTRVPLPPRTGADGVGTMHRTVTNGYKPPPPMPPRSAPKTQGTYGMADLVT